MYQLFEFECKTVSAGLITENFYVGCLVLGAAGAATYNVMVQNAPELMLICMLVGATAVETFIYTLLPFIA